MNSVHPPFLGQAQVAQKSWIVKNIFNTAKNFRENCFQGKCKLLKMLNVKSIFTTVKISRATLFFFMARENCSTILKLKTIINTAKNFRENSVFMAIAFAQNSWMMKYISMQWKISGQLCFFSGQAQVAQKSWIIKNIYSVLWIQGTLCFSGQEQVAHHWM